MLMSTIFYMKLKLVVAISCFILVTMALSSAAVYPEVVAEGWKIFDLGTGFRMSFEIDTEGAIHLAFLQDSQVKYAYWGGSKFEVEIVQNYAGPFGVLIDKNNTPNIFSYNSTNYITKRYIRAVSGWNEESFHLPEQLPLSFGNWPYKNYLRFDPSGKPALLYASKSSSYPYKCAVFYSVYDGSGWQNEKVYEEECINPYSGVTVNDDSIGFDSNGEPHVIFQGAFV